MWISIKERRIKASILLEIAQLLSTQNEKKKNQLLQLAIIYRVGEGEGRAQILQEDRLLMLLTSQSVTQKYWVINSLPLLIWEAPTICERQFVTALVLRFSKQTIRSIVPNSAYIWRKTHKVKAWVTPRPLYCKIIQRPKQFRLQRVSFFFSTVSKECWSLHIIQLHLWAVYVGLILICWIIIDGWGSSALLVNQ